MQNRPAAVPGIYEDLDLGSFDHVDDLLPLRPSTAAQIVRSTKLFGSCSEREQTHVCRWLYGEQSVFLGHGYDADQGTWSYANLTEARYTLAGAGIGGYLLFAGDYGDAGNSAVVDIYDPVSGWTSELGLAQGSANLAGAAAGNKVVFAGGDNDLANIYDVSPLSRAFAVKGLH